MRIDKQKILLYLAEREMTRAELADACNMRRQNLSTVLNRGTCEPRTAGRIATALGVPVAEIIKEE